LERPPRTFPSDTVPNPKEQCKAIQLRSGRLVENEKRSEVSSEKNAQGDDIVKKSEKNERKNCEDKFLRMSLRVSCGIVMDLIMGAF